MASLAGVSIGAGESTESKIATEIMKSWSFIERFIADNNLAVEVYAVNGWNKKTAELRIDNDKYDIHKKTWLLEDDYTGELRGPTSWELYERFQEILSVYENKDTGLVHVSIEYYSPQIAKNWVDLYVSSINRHMQSRQVDKVSNNIHYLEEEISRTSIAEMREVFYTLVEEQTKNKMVAKASPDYAFVTVGSSMIPEEKSKPKRAMVSVLGTLIGCFVGVLYVLIQHNIRSVGKSKVAI